MKAVKITRNTKANGGFVQSGDVVDVDSGIAKELVDAGVAEYVDAPDDSGAKAIEGVGKSDKFEPPKTKKKGK